MRLGDFYAKCVLSHIWHSMTPRTTRLLCPWDCPPITLEWVAIPSSRGSSWPRDWTHVSCVSCMAGRFFTYWVIRESPGTSLQRRLKCWPQDAHCNGIFKELVVNDVKARMIGASLTCLSPCIYNITCLHIAPATWIFFNEAPSLFQMLGFFCLLVCFFILSCYLSLEDSLS